MLFGLLLLSPLCLVTVSTLWVYLAVPSVGLIVVFPDHTHICFGNLSVCFDALRHKPTAMVMAGRSGQPFPSTRMQET